MHVLGKHHSKDIHKWKEDGEDQECGFHPILVCSCGTCGKKASGGSNDKEGEASGGSNDKEGEANGCADSESNSDSRKGGSLSNNGKGCRRKGGISRNNASKHQIQDDNEGESESNDDSDNSDENSSSSSGDCSIESDAESGTDDSDDEDGDEKLKCPGKPYSTRNILTCPLHGLLYEIECDRVGAKAKEVVHEEMGKGHSNLPESKFSVLTKFRAKSTNLHQVYYEFSTNCGLCQSNMTFMFNKEGSNYHWMRELLEEMAMPIPDGIEKMWKEENERRMNRLCKQKMKEAKAARANRKKMRAQESKKRYDKPSLLC